MNPKIYTSITDWYHPNIDFYDMIEKLRWTETLLQRANRFHMGKLKDEPAFRKFYEFPQDLIMLFSHCQMYELDANGKETIGHKQLFQFWNKQYFDTLATELEALKPNLILEVGAGDGILSKNLAERGLPVKATDNGSWKLEQKYEVEKMNYIDAIRKYEPDVIIGCWMPLNTDWTPMFRRKSTKHYIIIGEVEACCGGNWDKRKGWHMSRMKASKYGLCRTDDMFWHNGKHDLTQQRFHSSTILFSRT